MSADRPSKRPIRNADRDRDIAKLAESGKRQVELAELYGISQPRVAQIVARARKSAPARG